MLCVVETGFRPVSTTHNLCDLCFKSLRALRLMDLGYSIT
jgi:hypothetical protein